MQCVYSPYLLSMNKSLVITVLVSLLIGGGTGYLIGGSQNHPGNNNDTAQEAPAPGQHATTPDAMVQELMSKTGISRDETFLENMIMHHESAIAMSKIMLGKTERPELEQLAQDIIASQTKEIELMQGWLKEWYGR